MYTGLDTAIPIETILFSCPYPGRSVVKAVAVAQTELPPAARTFVKQVSRRYRELFDQ